MWKLLALVMLFSLTAKAQSLRAGVYRAQGEDTRLFLQALPGRTGSFLGLIVKNGTRAVPYLVDEFATGRYGFIPMYNQKNLIGATNYNPSLTASAVVEGRNLRVNVSPNPGNNVGFTSAMVFQSTTETSPWIASMPGTYSYRSGTYHTGLASHRNTVTLSPKDGANESQLSIAAGDMAGAYVLREVRPGMHLAFRSTLSTTGVEVVEESQWVVVFLRRCLGWSNQMVFINTADWSMRAFNN